MEVQVDPSGRVCGNDVHGNAVNVAIDGTSRSWHGRHEAARTRPCDAGIPNTRSIAHHASRTQVELVALACDRLGTEDVAERIRCCWTHWPGTRYEKVSDCQPESAPRGRISRISSTTR